MIPISVVIHFSHDLKRGVGLHLAEVHASEVWVLHVRDPAQRGELSVSIKEVCYVKGFHVLITTVFQLSLLPLLPGGPGPLIAQECRSAGVQ